MSSKKRKSISKITSKASRNETTSSNKMDFWNKFPNMGGNCTQTDILDLPSEILTKIIFLLTPRERLPLVNTCHRFKSLVFEDPELLRTLDFTRKACLTTIGQIQRYFNDEDACQHVRRVDVRDVKCLKAGDLLNNTIGKVRVSIANQDRMRTMGIAFEDSPPSDRFLLIP